jgi:hypothetical protein
LRASDDKISTMARSVVAPLAALHPELARYATGNNFITGGNENWRRHDLHEFSAHEK